jgi:hypothetical protein
MNTTDRKEISRLWKKRDLSRGTMNMQFMFISNSILLSHIISLLKNSRNCQKINYINGTEIIDSEVVFHNTEYDEWKIREEPKRSVNDCQFIFGSFPFAVLHHSYPEKWNQIDRRMDSSTCCIINSADMLSNDGIGLYITLPYGRTFGIDKLREHLLEKNCYVNAIINPPKNFLSPCTSIRPLLVLISKTKTEKEFVLNIEDSDNINFDLNNLFSNKEDKTDSIFVNRGFSDIAQGVWFKPGEFEGIGVYKAKKKIESLGGDYRKFESFKLEDLCKKIYTLPRKEHEGLEEIVDEDEKERIKKSIEDELKKTVYMPLIGKQDSCLFSEELINKPQNYIQLILNTNKILPAYLKNYLNSSFGKLVKEIEQDKIPGVIPRLNKGSAGKILISVPEIKAQRQVIDILLKLEKLQTKIKELSNNISTNPISDKSSLEKIIGLLDNLDLLTDEEKIRNLVSNGENREVEFKQTVTYCLRSEKKEQYITDAWIKNVAAFLNSSGGSLLVGISDNREIIGLNHEMETFFKQGGKDLSDNLMKHVKNILKDYIGEEFYPYIDSKLFVIDNKNVLWIKCKPSDKAVFIKKIDFYVRTNPSTDKLVGEKQHEYIMRRFEIRKG